VTVRLPPAQLEALDGWIARQAEPKPSRAEALRRLASGAIRFES
jgi:hypothetical protein